MFGTFCILSYAIHIAMHWKYQLEKRKLENWFALLSPSSAMLNLGAVEDIWSVLVEDDWLPVHVASTGHRQEGQEAEHGEVAPEWCGAPAVLDQDWLVRLAAAACQRSALPQRLPGRLPACLLELRGRRSCPTCPPLHQPYLSLLPIIAQGLELLRIESLIKRWRRKFFDAWYYTET